MRNKKSVFNLFAIAPPAPIDINTYRKQENETSVDRYAANANAPTRKRNEARKAIMELIALGY